MINFKKIIITILLVLTLTSIIVVAYEDNTQNINFEKCSTGDLNRFANAIMDYYLNSNNTISNYIGVIDSDVFREMNDNSLKLNCKIATIVVDRVYPNNSSTGDLVILINTKVWDQEQTYNNLYLMELHVNRDGKIYGYNIWAY